MSTSDTECSGYPIEGTTLQIINKILDLVFVDILKMSTAIAHIGPILCSFEVFQGWFSALSMETIELL